MVKVFRKKISLQIPCLFHVFQDCICKNSSQFNLIFRHSFAIFKIIVTDEFSVFTKKIALLRLLNDNHNFEIQVLKAEQFSILSY